MKVSDFVIKYLENYGIKNCYFVSGGMIMHMLNSLKNSNIKLIPTMSEQGAGIMTESSNIYSNTLNSILLTTAGPGILNALNPIASAYIDSTPLLVICGQCKIKDIKNNFNLRQSGVQEISIINVVKSITKYAVSIKNSLDIKYELEKCIYLSNSGRKGSVVLELPLDIQNLEINENELKSFYFKNNNILNDNNNKLLLLIEMLNFSKKPLILAGNGIRSSDSINQFKKLINKLNIPTLLTWKSADFLEENNNLFFGRPGSISSRYTNFILQKCDLLINIGSRLDKPTVAYDYKNFAKNAKKIVVDIDKLEIDKLNFDLEFNENSKDFLIKLNKELDNININTSEWLSECKLLKQKYSINFNNTKNDKNINPYYFIDLLSKISKKNDIITPSSSGTASEMMCQYFKIKKGQVFICHNGLGSMGYAISSSIGSCISSNKKRVICVEGDGSFNMINLSELELIKRYELPIKIFILNNGGYISIKNTQEKFFKNNLIGCNNYSGLSLCSVEKISKAFEIPYTYIYNSLNLEENLINILDNNNYELIELNIDSNQKIIPRVQSKMVDGKMISGKMEDMFPYIKE